MKIIKTLKKLLSVTLCAALIGGAAITVPAVVQDSAIIADALTYGDYEYSVSNNAVTITGYNGRASSVSIPSSIDGKPVTRIGYYAFSGCTSLTSVTIGNSVTSIGEYAFKDCTSLTSITIPNSVTSIGEDAFYETAWYNAQTNGNVYAGKVYYEYKGNMPDNTSIVLKPGTKGIADRAFYECTSLASITIPDSVTSIGAYAFYYCTILTSVILGNSVTSIGYSAFSYCTGLTSITIPDSVTSIGYCAFEYCESLTSITIPDSVTSIGGGAFSGCSSLTSVTIGDSVTSIGENAFYETAWYNAQANGDVYAGKVYYKYKGNMPDNTSIVLKPGTKGIAGGAFSNCTGLKSITIPDSVTSIGYEAFRGCSSLTSATIGNSVTSIGDWAFASCSSLTSITIPDSVTSIGDSAFEFCYDLTSITIPDSVTSIGDWAFDDCTSLTSITIPDSVTSIGSGTFDGCSSLTSITIPDSVTSIGDWAFDDCTSLTSITIPDSVTSIGDHAFELCSSLTRVTIPSSVTSIGGYAFYKCTGLTSITIGNSVTSIGEYAFYYCSSLTSINIPDSVTSIGDAAFWYCESLTSVTIPDSVTSIGNSAFRGCSSLISIDVDRNNKNYSSSDGVLYNKLQTVLLCFPGGKDSCSIPYSVKSIGDSAFRDCTRLTSVTIPDSVTSIGSHAFSACTGLKSITIPDSVTSIGYGAFSGCTSLTSVTIPDSVKSIGEWAFSRCTSLTSITIPDSVTSIDWDAFSGCNNLTSIDVDRNNKDYSSSDGVLYNKLKTILLCCPGGKDSCSIPDSVTSIGYGAFSGCTSLASITIPSSVKSIGEYAFSGCSSLTSLTIPSSVKSIDYEAFYGCSKLTIYGKSGSYAETYANENGIGFAVLPGFENTSSTSSESLTLGKKLTITGAAENGTAPYSYAYYFKRSANTKWNVIGTEFGTAKSATFKPTAAADYDIKVVVKDADGDTAEKLFKVTVAEGLTNTSWLNAEKVQIGDDIRVTGGAEGGAGGYKYAFYFKRSANSKWNKIGTEFGTKTYGITIPQAAVGYDMKVIVKDSAGNTAEKIFKVTVVESLPLTNISFLSAYDVPVGKTVTAAGRFVGGARPCTYEFYFKRTANTKWNKLSYGSAAGTYAKFTPTSAASYDIKVIAIDSKGTKASKVMTITAK